MRVIILKSRQSDLVILCCSIGKRRLEICCTISNFPRTASIFNRFFAQTELGHNPKIYALKDLSQDQHFQIYCFVTLILFIIISDGRCNRSCIQLDVLHSSYHHGELFHVKFGARGVKRVSNKFLMLRNSLLFECYLFAKLRQT